MTIQINNELCKRCHRCIAVCPCEVYEGEKGSVPTIAKAGACISCGHCVDVCTGSAIRHESFPEGSIHEVRTSLLPTPESLMELIKSRRSNRTITERAIPEEALRDIVEAARYAPTSENSRKVEVRLISSEDELQAIEDATMNFFLSLARVLLSPLLRPLSKFLLPNLYAQAPALFMLQRHWLRGERPCLCNAKAVLVFHAPRGFDFGYQDCNLAYQNSSLMAEAHGVTQVYLGFIQMGLKFMSAKKGGRLLGIPCDHRAYALMGLGMPAFRYPRYTER